VKGPSPAPASDWAEAVFHVLAHVDVGAVPPSCHEPGWIRWSEARLGPAADRELGEDVRVLAGVLATHEALAAANLLAWLWKDSAAARAATDRELASLGPAEVDDPGALSVLCALGPAAEVLRAAAELELPRLATLEPLAIDAGAWLSALDDVTAAAPELARCGVFLARPLARRGRVRTTCIVVGVPGVAGAELEHLAWQAAHEATIGEVLRAPAMSSRSFEDLERAALGLLRARARRAGRADAHGRWLATLDLRALGPIPDVDDGAG